MVEFILSALFGGTTGLVGSLLGRVFGWLETREKRKNMELEFTQEIKLIEAQARVRGEELEAEAAIADIAAASEMRTQSYRHDMSAEGAHRWVISTLRMVRPILTLMLIAITAGITFTFPTATSYDIANQVIYLTGMSVAWWFGDRAPARK
jgi:hypothetical protein